MSTILKALRRLEEDKRSQQSVSLEEDVLSPAELARRPRSSVLLLGITAGVSLAVILGAIVYAVSGLSGSGKPTIETRPASLTPPRPAEVREIPGSPTAVVAAQGRSAPVPAARAPDAPEAAASSEAAQLPPPPEAASLLPERLPEPVIPDPVRESVPELLATAVDVPSRPADAPARIDVRPVEPDPLPVKSGRVTSSRVAPAASVEVVDRRLTPAFSVTRTIWHPDPTRRVAVVELPGGPPQSLGEGDEIAGFTVLEIGLAGVELERDGVVLNRRVGAK